MPYIIFFTSMHPRSTLLIFSTSSFFQYNLTLFWNRIKLTNPQFPFNKSPAKHFIKFTFWTGSFLSWKLYTEASAKYRKAPAAAHKTSVKNPPDWELSSGESFALTENAIEWNPGGSPKIKALHRRALFHHCVVAYSGSVCAWCLVGSISCSLGALRWRNDFPQLDKHISV